MNIVGKGIKKIDGMSIIIGKFVYIDDLLVKDVLVVKIFRSFYVYVKIKDIEILKVEMVDGVECVLIYKDVLKFWFIFVG